MNCVAVMQTSYRDARLNNKIGQAPGIKCRIVNR
jgi:hypothetical protein